MAKKGWKQKGGLCIYCGRIMKPLTEDHIPPSCLFTEPWPTNLIKARSCLECNNRASDDDEYFKRCIVLSSEVQGHPEAKKRLPSIIRSLRMPEKEKQSREFLSSLTPVHLLSGKGPNRGETRSYEVDLERMSRVINRKIGRAHV